MAVEQPISPAEALGKVHDYYTKWNPSDWMVPQDCLRSIVVLQRYQDQPEVKPYLNMISPWIRERVMEDLAVSDVTLQVVPDHPSTVVHIEAGLQTARALGLDKVEQYQPRLIELRKKYQVETPNPEDEFVQAVAEIAIHSKFPQGLNFQDKVLVAPQTEWYRDYQTFSPTDFEPSQSTGSYANFLINCLDALINRGGIPQNLLQKHYLAIVPYADQNRPEKYRNGYSLLVYSSLQDRNIRDGHGRLVNFADIYFLMTTQKAQQFIQLVEKHPQGADIVEQFIQKAVPGFVASKPGEPGTHRVKASELVILDQTFLHHLLTARNNELSHQHNANLIGPRFLESIDQAVTKPYSQPVGFGIPDGITTAPIATETFSPATPTSEVITLRPEALGNTPGELLTRINQILESRRNLSKLSLQTSPQAILDYLQTIPLIAGATLDHPIGNINEEGNLHITGGLEVPKLGGTKFDVTYTQNKNGKLATLTTPRVDVGVRLNIALAARGINVNETVARLDKIAVEQINKRINEDWTAVGFRIVGKMLVIDLQRKTPPAPEPTIEPKTSQELIQEALVQGFSTLFANRHSISTGQHIIQETNDPRPNDESKLHTNTHQGINAAFQKPYKGGYEGPLEEERKAGIFEVVVFAPLERTIIKEVIESQGFLGKNKQVRHERHQKSVSMDEELGRPSDHPQPAEALYYYAAGDNVTNAGQAFRDFTNRPGGDVAVEIILPPQLSRAISAEIKRNPRFVRQLIDAFVRNKYPKWYIQESWDQYARPPYTQAKQPFTAWDDRPADERKFLFIDLVAHPEDRQLTPEQAIQKAVPY